MCGHVGLISCYPAGMTKIKLDLFEFLLYMDVARGPHATGVAGVTKNMSGDINMVKAAIPAAEFLLTDEYKEWASKASQHHILMGHNRYATLGDIKDETSHPFVKKHIVLAHNGTLFNHEKQQDGNLFESDSEWIAHSVSTRGIDATVADMWGSWSLVWADTSKSRVFFCRNEQRPMYYFMSGHGTTMVYGSELELLQWAVKRLKISVDGKDSGDYFYTRPNEVFEVDATGNKVVVSSRVLPSRPVKTYSAYTPPSDRYTHNNNNKNEGKKNKRNKRRVGGNQQATRANEATRIQAALDPMIGTRIPFGNVTVDESNTNPVGGAGLWGEPLQYFLDDLGVPDGWTFDIVGESDLSSVDIRKDSHKAWYGEMISFSVTVNERYVEILVDKCAPIKGKPRKKAATDLTANITKVTTINKPAPQKDGNPMMPYCGFLIPYQEWNRRVENGCTCCGAEIEDGDAWEVEWRQHNPYCAHCASDLERAERFYQH